MSIFEEYRKQGYKPKELGCFEEWTLWLFDNIHELKTQEIEETILQMKLSADEKLGIYEEHIQLCKLAISSKA